MGQSASRNTTSPPAISSPPHPHRSQSTTAVPSGASQPPQSDATDSLNSSASPSTKNTRRSSVRRSVRSFLRTRTQSDATTPSSSSSSSPHIVPSFRKRWRSTKRFSKAPASLPDLSEALQEGDRHPPATAAAVDAQVLPATDEPTPSHANASFQAIPTTMASAAIVSANRSDIAAGSSGGAVADGSSSARFDSNEANASVVVPVASAMDAQALHQHREQEIEREINDFLLERPRQDSLFVEGSSQDGRILDTPEPVPTDSVSSSPETDVDGTPEAMQAAPRHFPPPGTLVVVQGVVNTSDNPIAAQANPSNAPAHTSQRSSSVPRSDGQADERHGARRGLSALLPRPSSMLRQRSSTSEPGSASLHETRSSSDVSSSAFDTSASSEMSDNVSDPSLTSNQDQPREENDAQTRPLSPGSIDVLGTLLSVAAAATAASLFSPSLGFQANGDSNASPPAPGIPRPMSPTPTAGLGGGPGFSVVPDVAPDSPTSSPPIATSPSPQREGRERIRNVWESFRERLGLNRSGTTSTGGAPASTTEDPANMRPSEIMLAEMARALNIGLGLTPEGSSPESANASAEGQAPIDGIRAADSTRLARSPPPEDSFERFLINLQADLRVVLSENGVGASAQPLQDASGDNDADDTSASESAQRPDSPVPHHEQEQSSFDSSADDADDEELPPLQDASDSEDEDYDEMNIEDGTSVRTATPMPSGRDLPNRSDQSSPSEGSHPRDTEHEGDTERRPPGIQLWRLYRFQPIHASQIAGHAAATTPSNAPVFPHSPSTSTPSSPSAQADGSRSDSDSLAGPSSPISSSPTDGAESSSSSAPSGTDPNANMVVPVIVVGLQSVEMGQVHGHAQPPHQHHHEPEPTPSFDSRSANASTGSLDEGRRSSSTISADQSGDTTPRGRSWQSRAATALRNLRPGRRNGSSNRQTTEGTGSRTFLIYVIGGYYPPNHHMVTGPDNLDSYEALWELAELLGQVKPQVASWEDIEKSDLQIVKYSELGQYEREGKVASNCTERCLICLDDYHPDDDVRLMRCRHAFHKDCVDKWLQVGRNNCPACRSKGVSTADELVH
ncbi:hypothetical protein PYCCODRAFT_1367403 [Trametes coccinea BRFM310]|uniref:RING-type domain-containing protein n=1 Tax=Trametes coccinea (strain BRFM310) TaxID=1353009 RepID=A0A1Y2IMS2_TRAC3|nr:hypothetical protein PYCCODRAFT_1367403 [Trametes coccinea BRFM310]